MDCKDLVKLISDYIDEDLDADVICGVDEHLEECPFCKPFLISMETTIKTFTYSQQWDIPKKVSRDLTSKLKSHARKIKRKK